MGKKVAAVAVAVLFGSTYALGGTVGFDPSKHDNVLPGDTVTFDVSVESANFDGFNSIGMLFASDDLVVVDFAYSDGFLSAITPGTELAPGPFNPPIFPNGSELNTGGISLFSDSMNDPFFYGTLTVSVPGDLAVGSYEVFVNSDLDGGVSGLTKLGVDEPEPLTGRATVNVVPEPATIALLGLGAVGLIRRRQSV